MRRRTVFIAVGVLIVGLVATAFTLLHTQTALRWTVAEIQARSGGSLQIGSANGSLAGTITLHDVRVTTPSFHAHISRITLEWVPLELLVNRLALTRLVLEGVKLTLTPTSGSRPWQLVNPAPPHLPLVIVVDDLAVKDMQVTAPQLAEPLQIAQIRTAAQMNNHKWSVSTLSVEGRDVQVRGHASWAFRNGEQLNAALVWNLLLPQQPRFTGQLTLAGGDQKLLFDMSLQAPAGVHVQAEIHNLFSAPAWQGTLQLKHLQLQRFGSALPNVDADGAAQFSGSPANTDFNGSLDAHEPETGDWHGRFAMQYRETELLVKQLELARRKTRTRFELQGKVSLANAVPAPDLRGQ